MEQYIVDDSFCKLLLEELANAPTMPKLAEVSRSGRCWHDEINSYADFRDENGKSLFLMDIDDLDETEACEYLKVQLAAIHYDIEVRY